MLKIKDDVDLKELEKYGFEFVEESKKNPESYAWRFETKENYNYLFIPTWSREILGCDLVKTYDLIKADLVEKVGNEDK